MKPERPYNARQYDDNKPQIYDDNKPQVYYENKPQIYYENSVADYLTQPDFETMRQAKSIATMLNNARELGYNNAKGDLRRWLNL